MVLLIAPGDEGRPIAVQLDAAPTQQGFGTPGNPTHPRAVTAEQCPRIPRAFLEEERLALGPRWFRQEYECSFEETVDAVFTHADVQAALSDDVRPLLPVR